MKKFFLKITLIFLLSACAKNVQDTSSQNQTYGNTTQNTRLSAEKIDGSQTYEVFFTIDKPAECMTINIETAYLQKTFPVQKIPKNTFFIVEKKLRLPQFKANILNGYTPMGRNFNNDWELFSPIKICGSQNDPLSIVDASEYRIRFTAFEKTELYYIITVTCESKILFTENTAPLKK